MFVLSVYSHDPYVAPKNNEEEVTRLREEVAALKKENHTLKTRARLDYTGSGGKSSQQPTSYNRGGARGSRGGRNGGQNTRSYSLMTLPEKQAATCSAWNRTSTPGGAGGCPNVETNGHCSTNGVTLRHACSAVKPGTTMICWDRRHTALGH